MSHSRRANGLLFFAEMCKMKGKKFYCVFEEQERHAAGCKVQILGACSTAARAMHVQRTERASPQWGSMAKETTRGGMK